MSMEDLVADMVANGEAASKGAARRKLGIEQVETTGLVVPWHDRIRKGIAGAGPALPNQ